MRFDCFRLLPKVALGCGSRLPAFLLLLGLAVGAPTLPLRADTAAVPKPNANLDLARQLNEAFVQVAEQVSPAVVVIDVTEKATPATGNGDDSAQDQDDSQDESPFDQLPPELRKRLFPHHNQAPMDEEPAHAQGSGVIVRKDGYILTNRHVVEDADRIEVRLQDGRTFKATVRGEDAPSDVAVIKIEATNLPVARLADSSRTRVGEFAIAIGAPFGMDYSVTFGHVSAKDRSNLMVDPESPTLTDQDFIQTDANINPGNSGGPLVNIEGEVIGINTLIRGLHTGIGFAIPINLAREVAERLITDGKFTRSWLGISIRSLREWPEYKGLVKGLQDGVAVWSIVPNGPAAKSDLRPGDVITTVDGTPVVTSQQLKDAVRTKPIGKPVTLEVMRADAHGVGKPLTVLVKPGEWNENQMASNESNPATPGASNALGLTVKTLTRQLADQFNVDFADGVIVTAVDRSSAAAHLGIKAGDIITSVNQQPVTNSRQFRDVTRNADLKKGVILNLISAGEARFEILKEDN